MDSLIHSLKSLRLKKPPSSVSELKIRPTHSNDKNTSDARMYGSNQDAFIKETSNYIDDALVLLQSNNLQFNEFLEKIGSFRKDLAIINNERHSLIMGDKRETQLSTVISKPYYAERALNLLQDLEQARLSNPQIAKKFNLPEHHKRIPYLINNQYIKYQVYYKTDTGKELPLTRCYVTKGKYLPAHPQKGTFFPDKTCNLLLDNGRFRDDFKEFDDFIKCKNIEEIVRHSNYEQFLNSQELTELAKSFLKDDYRELIGEAFMATFGKPIRGQRSDKNIADKDSWCCIENPNEKNQAMGIGLCHTTQEEMQEILVEANKEFLKYQTEKNKNKNKAFKHGCNVIYLVAHACPFRRGSAWSAEVIASTIMRDLYKKKDISFIKSNLDFLAFGKNSDDFSGEIKKYLKQQ